MSKFNGNDHSQDEIDNRANQLNPEHDAYASSRGDVNYDDDDYYDYDDES
jgi:hypothetical protein